VLTDRLQGGRFVALRTRCRPSLLCPEPNHLHLRNGSITTIYWSIEFRPTDLALPAFGVLTDDPLLQISSLVDRVRCDLMTRRHDGGNADVLCEGKPACAQETIGKAINMSDRNIDDGHDESSIRPLFRSC